MRNNSICGASFLESYKNILLSLINTNYFKGEFKWVVVEVW